MLADKDIVRIHAALNECHALASLEEFKTFIRTRARQVLPHQMALCGLSEIGSGRLLRLINIDFPAGYLQHVVRPDQILLSSPLREWLGPRSPMIIRLDQPAEPDGSLRYPGAGAHGITSLACHGFVDVSSTVYTFFLFGQLNVRMMASYTVLLNLVVAHLHAVLTRLLTTEHLRHTGEAAEGGRPTPWRRVERRSPEAAPVTDRERQVLRWIAAGKSNWEIGKILRISEFTAKNHVQSILKKLSVTSRAQAVSTAIFSGLIDRDADAVEPGPPTTSNSRRAS